jgi:hypothetical protein
MHTALRPNPRLSQSGIIRTMPDDDRRDDLDAFEKNILAAVRAHMSQRPERPRA